MTGSYIPKQNKTNVLFQHVSACFSKRLHGLARHGGHLAQAAACTQRLENDLQTARKSKLFQTSLDRVEPRWINLISDAQP